VSCWHGDPADLFDLDGGCDGGVAEQALGDPEVGDDSVEAVTERDTCAREYGEPGELAQDRGAAVGLAARRRAARGRRRRSRRLRALSTERRGDPLRGRVGLTLDKEAVMPLARVVSFDGVSSERMAEMQREMEGGERPENVPAKEIVVLHDPEGEKSLVILFFENEDDYLQGDEALNAMPADDTPGQRNAVAKYQVAFRMTD